MQRDLIKERKQSCGLQRSSNRNQIDFCSIFIDQGAWTRSMWRLLQCICIAGNLYSCPGFKASQRETLSWEANSFSRANTAVF